MRVNPIILQDVLREAIAEVNKRPSTFHKDIKTVMAKIYNLSSGETTSILNGRLPVETLSEATMYKITKVLHDSLEKEPLGFNISNLDVDKYFLEDEQKEYKKKIDRKEVDNDIKFDQFVQIAKDQIVVTMSNKQIAQLVGMNKIQYNPETQRNMTVIETKEGTIKKVTLVEKSLDSICENMISGDYIPDSLTFNINIDSYEQPRIVGGKAIVPSGSIIDCIDGYHRVKASTIITKLHPEVEFNFIIILTGFDVAKARKYIIQENYKNPLTDEQVTEYDQKDPANFIIDKLKESLYFKDSKLSEIHYQLNNVIDGIFKLERLNNPEQRQKALLLFKNIEKNMNNLIETNFEIGKAFSINEWFIYLYVLDYCLKEDYNFVEIVNKINVNNILNEIEIVNKPIKGYYKLMRGAVKNVSTRR